MWDSGLIDEKLGLELSRDDENVLPLSSDKNNSPYKLQHDRPKKSGITSLLPHSTPPNQNSVIFDTRFISPKIDLMY